MLLILLAFNTLSHFADESEKRKEQESGHGHGHGHAIGMACHLRNWGSSHSPSSVHVGGLAPNRILASCVAFWQLSN